MGITSIRKWRYGSLPLLHCLFYIFQASIAQLPLTLSMSFFLCVSLSPKRPGAGELSIYRILPACSGSHPLRHKELHPQTHKASMDNTCASTTHRALHDIVQSTYIHTHKHTHTHTHTHTHRHNETEWMCSFTWCACKSFINAGILSGESIVMNGGVGGGGVHEQEQEIQI